MTQARAVSQAPPAGFASLPPRVGEWLFCEQTVNERIFQGTPLQRTSADTLPAYVKPERRASWRQRVVWLPQATTRTYGRLGKAVEMAFGVQPSPGTVPLLVHPRATAAHRRLAGTHGSEPLGDVMVTPTASYRSLLAVAPGRGPVVTKLSLGAIIGRFRRHVDETQVATGVLVTRTLDLIPAERRRLYGLDWFGERSGMVDGASGEGWLLRDLPEILTDDTATGYLMPCFSLIAARGEREPLLVELIRRDGRCPERFVVEEILTPYVRALGYLLFAEGVHVEGHGQNVLLELARDTSLPTGRVVLRDLGDMSVSIPLRLARGLSLPSLDLDLPARPPRPLGTIAATQQGLGVRTGMIRAREVILTFGLGAFIWSIDQSLTRFFDGYDAELVARGYLELWRDAMASMLPVSPRIRHDPPRIPTDEVIAHVLCRIDWPALGTTPGVSLPSGSEPLLIGPRARRRPGPVYDRLDSSWGEMYLDRGRPAFFRPAR